MNAVTPHRDLGLLYGAAVIAKALRVPRSRVYQLARDGAPIFKLVDHERSPLVARRVELDQWLTRRQAEASGITAALDRGA